MEYYKIDNGVDPTFDKFKSLNAAKAYATKTYGKFENLQIYNENGYCLAHKINGKWGTHMVNNYHYNY